MSEINSLLEKKHKVQQQRQFSKRITSVQGLYLKYRLKCIGCSSADIAHEIGCAKPTVAKVLSGRSHSRRIERAVAERLGYPSWNEMVEHLRREALT